MTKSTPNSRRARIIVGVCVVSIIALVAMGISSKQASAYFVPKIVLGHVYEGDTGHPVSGASVIIKILYSGGGTRWTEPVVYTDGDGLYQTTVASGNWDPGDLINVTVTYNSNQMTDEATADTGPSQTFDFIFPYAIPQLAGTVGMMVTIGAVGAAAIVFLRRKPIEA